MTGKGSSLFYLSGCGKIYGRFQQLVDSKDLEKWAQYFSKNCKNFSSALDDFKQENVEAYLEKVYNTCCQEGHEALLQGFHYLLTARGIYFIVQVSIHINSKYLSLNRV